MVILLMAILAGVLLPGAAPAVHDQLQSAAEVVASDLSYARSLAVTYGSSFGIRFDADANAYSVEHMGANASLNSVPSSLFAEERSASGGYVVQLDRLPRLGSGVRLLGAIDPSNPSALVGQVTFDPLGGLASGRTLQVWLAAGTGKATRYIAVSIHPVTGLVSVMPYTDSLPLQLIQVQPTQAT